MLGQQLVDDEGDDQQPAGQQQADDHAGIEPVEAIALVEPGIDQGEAEPREDDAAPVGARSSSRSIGSRGMPNQTSTIITGVSSTFCQKIHCHCPVSP